MKLQLPKSEYVIITRDGHWKNTYKIGEIWKVREYVVSSVGITSKDGKESRVIAPGELGAECEWYYNEQQTNLNYQIF